MIAMSPFLMSSRNEIQSNGFQESNPLFQLDFDTLINYYWYHVCVSLYKCAHNLMQRNGNVSSWWISIRSRERRYMIHLEWPLSRMCPPMSLSIIMDLALWRLPHPWCFGINTTDWLPLTSAVRQSSSSAVQQFSNPNNLTQTLRPLPSHRLFLWPRHRSSYFGTCLILAGSILSIHHFFIAHLDLSRWYEHESPFYILVDFRGYPFFFILNFE
jgi:hypothetical protein